jgi:hypothetical protein
MPQIIRELGAPPFARQAMKERLPEFLRVFAERPFKDNHGGMRAPHLFGAWFMVQTLRPTHIVESGIFKGLGTWLLEQAAPEARLCCIDPNPASIVYRSARAQYFTRDFSEIPWDLPRETTLLFFDDHQDALSRVELAEQAGFVHLIFEDNYPAERGDCYSLKKALMGEAVPPPKSLGQRALRALKGPTPAQEDPVGYLERTLETYFEFPPVRRPATTRWGDAWTDDMYPTPPTLLDDAPVEGDPFLTDAQDYTWICYAKLKTGA